MTTIDQLLQQYCPDGVEFKNLWEVTSWDKRFNAVENKKQNKILSFKHIPAKDLRELETKNGNVKLLATGKFEGWTTELLAGKNLNEGEIISIPSGGSASIKYYKGKFVDSGNILASSINDEILNLKYCYYFLLIKNELIENYFRGAGVKHPSMSEILDLQIPIPPLPIQIEIVRILDTFTQLEAELGAELGAELEARKSQYEYYRDEMLSFGDDEVEWKSLGEVGIMIRGNGLQKKDFTEDGFPCIHYGQLYTHYGAFANKTKSFCSPVIAIKLRHAKYGDVLIAGTSENVEDVNKATGWLGDNEIAISGDMFAFRPNTNLDGRFLTYIFQTKRYFDHKKKYARGTKVTRVASKDIEKFQIPIPPLPIQIEIVAILDKFDALVNDISIGLPAELAARRQQYEYYREKLLRFKELK